MKIITLTSENFKRLKAVDITPSEHVQIVGGRNAQGKTSVLDALWQALGGGPAAKGTTRPVRDGEETASVRLDLGEYVVTRTWSGEKSTLRVESAEGARFSSPQGMLDALVGRLSFDPLEFTRLSGKAQVAALLDLVDLDVNLNALADARATAYSKRTDVGRQVKQLEGHLASLPDVADKTPDDEVSSADILAELRAAQEADRALEVAELRERRAKAAREQAASALETAVAEEKAATAAFEALPDVPDVAAIEQRLSSVEDTNRAVRAKQERSQVSTDLLRERLAYEDLTKEIDRVDKQKSKALAAADFPVDGLGFDDDGVTLHGLPFSQASSAEQIRVSLAMAMSLNPRLRVIRILDGSLLDADNLALIESMARESDYQVWIERVGNADEGAVIIEDGEVAA